MAIHFIFSHVKALPLTTSEACDLITEQITEIVALPKQKTMTITDTNWPTYIEIFVLLLTETMYKQNSTSYIQANVHP